MMPIAMGDSGIRQVSDKTLSPLKSRSTVIFISCLLGLLYLNCLCWVAGFFSEAIALVSIYLMRDIMVGVNNHQKTADAIGSIPPSKIP